MKTKKKKQITVKEWIDEEGTSVVAAALGVTQAAVGHWHRGWVLPDSRQMRKIRKLSRERVSMDLTLDAHFSDTNKKNRYNK